MFEQWKVYMFVLLPTRNIDDKEEEEEEDVEEDVLYEKEEKEGDEDKYEDGEMVEEEELEGEEEEESDVLRELLNTQCGFKSLFIMNRWSEI